MSLTWRNTAWLLPLLLAGLAGCGFRTPAPAAGQPGSISLSLKTVPTIRSITVSPKKASFGSCSGGYAQNNTASAGDKLGYPNARCWVGITNPYGSFPIKITNTGIAAYVYVNGSNAVPSDNGSQWQLCNLGRRPAVSCTGRRNRPGVNQYLVQNFGPSTTMNTAGLTGTPACDHQFDPSGKCWAVQGTFQTEGIKLTGPSTSTDNATNWTVTITWTPVPG